MGRFRILLILALLITVSGCDGQIPTDPEGTLTRARGGELIVGISHNPPWTDVFDAEGPRGTEARLVEDYAADIGAEVRWHVGGEEELMKLLKDRELDMIVGGLTDDSPWTSHAALTIPYTESTGADGSTEKHVMAVRLGENAFMVDLEKFLLGRGAPR